jgi:hypothetical protein
MSTQVLQAKAQVLPTVLDRLSRFAWPVAVVLTVISVIAAALIAEAQWLFNPHIVEFSRSLGVRDGVDTSLLLSELETKPTFMSTLSWWHTHWIPQSNWWRPLSMQSFWLERHFFGTDRYDYWMWISFALTLLCALLFGLLAYNLTQNRWLALLGVLIYSGWRFIPLFTAFQLNYETPSNVVLNYWKDQPDLWVDSLFFGAFIAALRSKWSIWIALSMLALCFKESGIFSILLPLATLALTGRFAQIPKRVLCGLMAVFVGWAGIMVSIPSSTLVSISADDNRNWMYRYGQAVCGEYGTSFVHFFPEWLLGNGLFFSILLYKRFGKLAGYLSFVAALAVSVISYAHLLSMPIFDTIAAYTDPVMLRRVFVPVTIDIAVWLSLFSIIIRDKKLLRTCGIYIGFAMITAIPYALLGYTTEHVLHQAYAFQTLFMLTVVASFLNYHRSRLTNAAPL